MLVAETDNEADPRTLTADCVKVAVESKWRIFELIRRRHDAEEVTSRPGVALLPRKRFWFRLVVLKIQHQHLDER